MLVMRKSMISGEYHTLEIPCTKEQFDDYLSGTHIQTAMSDVPAELREFVISGITPEEWNNTFILPEERPDYEGENDLDDPTPSNHEIDERGLTEDCYCEEDW
jgi:hypothetical protein